MRNRWRYFHPLQDYLGLLLLIFGVLLLVPLAGRFVFDPGGHDEAPPWCFSVPALICVVLGALLKRDRRFPALDNRLAMLVCVLGWVVVSVFGAMPFYLALEDLGPLDAFFEGVSGITTTGMTVLGDLDSMPLSILLWRSFLQWLGGLGILAFFLAVLYTGGSAHRLFGAESHKVFAKRPAPSLSRSLRILWQLYVVLTGLIFLALCLEGLSIFDSLTHAMTTVSTGGYSPYDAGIGHFSSAGYEHYILIEYTIILGMLLGGISFFVHYRLVRGGIRALWDTLEMRLWWGLLLCAVGLVVTDRLCKSGWNLQALGGGHDLVRNSAFQVISVMTTTGFATEDIASSAYPAAAKLVFLMLMVIGGCVGSTSGGVKVLRIGVLYGMVTRQVRLAALGRAAVQPVVVDGEVIDTNELRRIAALLFAWVVLLAIGALVTALLSEHDAMVSASGMFSALGNIGPSYIPAAEIAGLHWAIKMVYIVGMLAGRLEILPLLLLVSRRTWK